jgi:hypothetical protein
VRRAGRGVVLGVLLLLLRVAAWFWDAGRHALSRETDVHALLSVQQQLLHRGRLP